MPSAALHARALPLPVPPRAHFGYGTAWLRIPGTREVLFGWMEGAKKAWLVRWDLATGRWEKIRALGLPRDAVFQGDRAWVLTTDGLQSVALHPLETLAERTEDIPDWSLGLRLIPGADDECLLFKRRGETCLRVTLDAGESERISAPAPDLLVRRGGEVQALAFDRGVGYPLERPHETFDIPHASAAILVGDRVFVAPGIVGPSRQTVPPMQTDHVFDVHSDGTLREFHAGSGLGPVLVDLGAPIVRLEGPTRAGHVIATSPEGLHWIDIAGREVIAFQAGARGPVCVLDDVVLVPSGSPDRPAQLYAVGEAAARHMEAFVPPELERPSAKTAAKTAAAREEGVVACEYFKNVRISGNLGPARFRECEFAHCGLGDRTVATEVRGIELVNCRLDRCSIQNARLVDCRFERLAVASAIILSVDFLRVVLAGRIEGSLMLQHFPPAMLERRGVDDWALDISRGEFTGLELRGMPSRLVRRDPETQVVVRRERALDRRWGDLPIGAFSISLGLFVNSTAEDVVLVAARRGKRFAEQMEALKLLRSEGIAEPD